MTICGDVVSITITGELSLRVSNGVRLPFGVISNSRPVLLGGATALRSAYVVYHAEGVKVRMAQAKKLAMLDQSSIYTTYTLRLFYDSRHAL
jgi:hypothetical protein